MRRFNFYLVLILAIAGLCPVVCKSGGLSFTGCDFYPGDSTCRRGVTFIFKDKANGVLLFDHNNREHHSIGRNDVHAVSNLYENDCISCPDIGGSVITGRFRTRKLVAMAPIEMAIDNGANQGDLYLAAFVILTLSFSLVFFKGRYTEQENIVLQSEVNRLFTEYHEQKSRLSEIIVLKDRLSGVLAHDVLAAISSIKQLLQHVEIDNIATSKVKHLLSDSVVSLDEFYIYVANTHELSRAQCERELVFKTQFPAKILVRECVAFFAGSAKFCGSKFSIDIDEQLVLHTDRRILSIILHNIFSNCIKHSPGSIIHVTCKRDQYRDVITIRDEGTGYPQEVIERFNHRSSRQYFEERSRKCNMNGVGLCLARELGVTAGIEVSICNDKITGSATTNLTFK